MKQNKNEYDKKRAGKEFLDVFLKCSICNSFIPYDTELCDYCGGVTSYDDEFGQYYISGRVCFDCGFENKPGNIYCENCKIKFGIICPKCRRKLEIGEGFCKNCSFRIDEFYIENEVNKRLTLLIKGKTKTQGLYVAAALFFLLALLFTFLGFTNENNYKFGLIFAALILYALFAIMLKSLSTVKRR